MTEDYNHLHVRFYNDAVIDEAATKEAGRPIYKDVEKAEIKIAGDKSTVLVVPAKDQSSVRDPETNQRLTYAQLHYKQYEAFKRQEEFFGSGTPLSELPFLTEGKRRELKAANVHTAEALAGLDGSNLNRLGMGARELKNKAQNFLDVASGSADFDKLSAENKALKARLDALEGKISTNKESAKTSHFDDWDDETIRVWIVEQGGETPHHKCSRATLITKADELNNAIALKRAG